MKEVEGSINERLDHLGRAMVCQESERVERLDDQRREHRTSGGRWNGTEGSYVTD